MSYSNPFNATLIPGNTQAKLIDDTFRSMHAALIERLNDKIVVSATADPWVLKPEVSGLKVGKVINIPFINFVPLGGGSVVINLDNITTNGLSNAVVAGFVLPPGVTITGVEVRLLCSSIANLELYKVSGFVPPFTKVSIAAWTQNPVGQIVSPNGTTLNEVVTTTDMYYISADLASSDPGQVISLYGARVIYNASTHLNTI